MLSIDGSALFILSAKESEGIHFYKLNNVLSMVNNEIIGNIANPFQGVSFRAAISSDGALIVSWSDSKNVSARIYSNSWSPIMTNSTQGLLRLGGAQILSKNRAAIIYYDSVQSGVKSLMASEYLNGTWLSPRQIGSGNIYTMLLGKNSKNELMVAWESGYLYSCIGSLE